MAKIKRIIENLTPPTTVLFFAFVFVLGLIILTLFRLGFLLWHKELAQNIPFSIIFHSFVIGTRFDMVILSYFFIPLFILASIPLVGMAKNKSTRVFIQIILFSCFALIFLAGLVDLEFFGQFGTRLNYLALDYFEDFGPVAYTIWEDYPIVPYLLLWAILTFVFIWLCLKISKNFFKGKKESIISQITYFIIILALLFLGARGRIKLAPIDWGLAYFSKYDFANQLSLNGVFTLGKSYFEEYSEKENNYLKEYHCYDTQEAEKQVNEIFSQNINSVGVGFPRPQNEDFIRAGQPRPYNFLQGRKPNLVIILLESWLAKYVGVLGAKEKVTPHFDSLAQNGILLEKLFATGTRTNRGVVSVLCSFPSQPGRSIMRKFTKNYPFSSIAQILKNEGYENIFIYGGDLQFDNMQGFLRGVGFDKFMGQSNFSSSEALNKWGVPDDIVFEKANKKFSEMKEPFLGVVLTLSNHEPFVLPEKNFNIFPKETPFSDYLNAYYYSDWALGKFFHLAKEENYFQNTIFVLVADHGKLLEATSDLPLERFQIVGLFYAPGILKNFPKKIPLVTSQTDIVPTIVGLLGIKTNQQFWGRDVFSLDENKKGLAMFLEGKRVGYIQGEYFLIDRIGANLSLYNWPKDPQQKEELSAQFPEIVEELKKKERSLLQVSIERIKESLKK